VFQTLKGSLQTIPEESDGVVEDGDFKPSKDRYKLPVVRRNNDIRRVFQTLKGSLQTLFRKTTPEYVHGNFKPSKDRYKRFSPNLSLVYHRISNPQRIATNG